MNNSSEGIVVYCKKGNIIFSSNGDLIESKQNVRKHKIKKTTVHKEFQDMLDFTEDEYWKNIFTKFSKNIFPKNFKYMDSILYYKITAKKHRSECFVDKEELKNSYENLINFLKEKGFLSKKEKEKNEELIEINKKEEENFSISNWKDVYNEDYYLTNFMILLKEKYNLKKSEYNNLESILNLGINSEFFNSDNIEVNDQRIENIKNLVWDENNRKFSINIENIKFKKKVEKKDPNKYFTSYTIETSNDNSTVFFEEVCNIEVQKKFSKFLENLYW